MTTTDTKFQEAQSRSQEQGLKPWVRALPRGVVRKSVLILALILTLPLFVVYGAVTGIVAVLKDLVSQMREAF